MSLGPDDVGHRVSIRYLVGTVDGTAGGRPLHTDALGVLESLTDATWGVRRRDGRLVEVPISAVVALRSVPDTPAARGRRPGSRPAADWSTREVEEVASTGWPGLEQELLGDWVLRAAAGFTGRANSALPVGDPGMPTAAAIAHVEGFYRSRALPPRFQVPLPLCHDLDEWLAASGWRAVDPVQVMVADLAPVLAAVPARDDLPPVQVDLAPDRGWLAAYHYRGGALPPVATSVLAAGEGPVFAAVRDSDSAVLAIARAAISRGWVGVTAVEVAEPARRRGLGTHLMRELLSWAGRNGAHHAYLQVAEDNAPARALYDRMGFATHHTYHYRVASR